jgi:hypothetical protein
MLHGHTPKQAVTICLLSSDQNAAVAEMGLYLLNGEFPEVKYRGGEDGTMK